MKNAFWSFLYCSMTGVMIMVNALGTIIVYIISFFIAFPFLLTIVLYIGNKMANVHPLMAFHRSMAWSTLVYIFSVIQMLSMFFDKYFIGIFACLFLISLSSLIIYQYRKETDIELKKASRILWRICFLLFNGLYIVLVIYGIVLRLY